MRIVAGRLRVSVLLLLVLFGWVWRFHGEVFMIEQNIDRDDITGAVRSRVPGVLVLVVIAVGTRSISSVIPHVSPLVAAVAAGIFLANVIGVPEVFAPGIGTYKIWLEAGIVLMGARIAPSTLIGAGLELLLVVGICVTVTIFIVEKLATSLFGIHAKLGSLLAAGAGVCGVSAVIGVAGSIRATEEQIAYAAGTILLFDVVTLFVYPVIGGWLGLADRVFGVWAGLTMFSTGPVTAAGFSVSETAGQWATITKLTRNLLLGVLVGIYSIRYTDLREQEAVVSVEQLWAPFPKFVFGFFAVMILTSSSLISTDNTAQLLNAYHWLFLIAFVGLGLRVELADLRTTGVRPVALVFTTLVLVSTIALVVVQSVVGG